MDCKLERVRKLVWKRRHYVLTLAVDAANEGDKRNEMLLRERVKCLDMLDLLVQQVDAEFGE